MYTPFKSSGVEFQSVPAGNSYPRCNCYHEDADDFEDDEDYGTIDSDVSSMSIFLHFVGYSMNLDVVLPFSIF